MRRTDSIPVKVRAKIENKIGPMDPMLLAVALSVWTASSGEELYDAERAVHLQFAKRGDVIVGELLAARAKQANLVNPAKADVLAQAKNAGVRLKSHGLRSTVVRLMGGTIIRLKTLAMLPETQPGQGKGPSRNKPIVSAPMHPLQRRRESSQYLDIIPVRSLLARRLDADPKRLFFVTGPKKRAVGQRGEVARGSTC